MAKKAAATPTTVTLKHLAAAAACYALLRYIQQRRPLAQPAGDPRTAA